MKSATHLILVVDDEPDLREILAYAFERQGYEVFQAGNAVEALEVVKKNKIKVVISDIRMPGGDGIQLLDEVKKYNREIPTVLFMTGFADITFEEAYDKGAEAIFSKPFDTKLLIGTVDKIIKHQLEPWAGPRVLREPCSFNIDLKLKAFAEAKQAKVLNIGRGGFFVSMSENFPKVDDLIGFRIVFDEGPFTVIEGNGTVRWVRAHGDSQLPAGCGIEFQNLEGAARGKIFELTNTLMTNQFIPKS